MKLSRLIRYQGIYILLIALAITDVGFLIYVTHLRRSVETSGMYLHNQDHSEPNMPPEGYSADGMVVNSSTGMTKGWIVRYASQACKVCATDRVQWRNLRSALLEKGYRVYVILPTAGDAYPNGSSDIENSTQILYPSIEWIKRYRLTATPTTLLFNSRGEMIWSHLGKISQEDQKAAVLSTIF